MFASLSLEVIDPCNRTGKICIPMQHVDATKGVSDFRANPAKRDGKELSLCLLFQKGRCNAGSKCHQVHADPSFVNSLREKALSAKNCCAAHGDVHSCGFLTSTNAVQYVKLLNGDEERLYALSSFGRTSFLDTALRSAKNGVVRVPAAKVCRLHAQSRCKFGKDCKNVHLCCDATTVEQTPKRAPAPVTIDISCGLSNTGSHKSSLEATPRDSPVELPNPLELSHFSSGHEFSYFSSTWGAASSPQFDMSGIQETIRTLCQDLTTKSDPLAVGSRW